MVLLCLCEAGTRLQFKYGRMTNTREKAGSLSPGLFVLVDLERRPNGMDLWTVSG